MLQVLAALVCQKLFSTIKVIGYDCYPFRQWLPFLLPLCSSYGQTGRVCHDGLEGSFFLSHDVAVDLVPSCLATIVSCNDKRRRFVQSFIIFKSHQKAKDHESFYKVNRREANDPKIAFDSHLHSWEIRNSSMTLSAIGSIFGCLKNMRNQSIAMKIKTLLSTVVVSVVVF